MSMPGASRDMKAEGLLLAVVVIWASNFPVAKYGIAGLDIFVFNGIRYVVAAGVIAALFLWRSSWKPVRREDRSQLLRVGFVANVLYQLAFIVGLKLTTAGNSAILLSTAPLWTIFLNARMHKQRIAPQMWFGAFLSLCGIVMIITGSGKKIDVGSSAMLGDLICVTAAFLWAFSTNLQKPLLASYSPTQLTFVMVVVGAVGLSLLAVPSATELDWSGVHWTYYLAAIASGALSTAAANLFWSYGVKRLGPGHTANFGNLVPVLALAISYFALGEGLLLIQFIGAGVTIGGVWLARRGG